MRIQQLGGRPPEEIPVAGVTLRDLLGDVVTLAHVHGQFSDDPLSNRVADVLKEDDEVRRFRTPPWTWANMSGMEGFVVMRSGKAICWIVTRMN
ncbi:MAG: hypothetical protein ABFD16_07600 [Thermoguttaceae bacterium]